jgi:hypothetical protein
VAASNSLPPLRSELLIAAQVIKQFRSTEMPIVAANIIAYGSASMPDDDTPTGIGGAIDLTTRIVFTDISATDTVEILSDAGGDTTQDVTIYGRNAAGELISELASLDGTNVQTTTATFERILKIVMSATATGTVTVRKQTDDVEIATLEPGVTQIRRPFYDAAAEASGGAERDYYEKIFFKNDHATLTLTSAVIKENADPSTFVDFDLEDALDDNDTNGAGDRQTHDGGYTFDSNDKNVVNGQNLTAQSAQGCWLRLKLAAGEDADNTSFTMRVTGNTTA